MSIIYEKFKSNIKSSSNHSPVTIIWNNARMIKNHSFRACAREILAVNMGIDVVKINVIGDPSTGKTTLVSALAHICHDLANTPYAVKSFTRDDLMDMENTLAKLQPMNHIMIFDDISWLSAGSTKQKLDQIQKTFTEIRHLKGGQDIKVIIFFLFHYQLSISKHLRQADFFIFTSIGSSELENTQKLVGQKNTGRILDFRRAVQEAKTTGKPATKDTPEIPGTFSYKIGKKANKKFTYTFRKPFAPALWWNQSSLRQIVFPSREWIEPICPICTGSIVKTEEEQFDLAKFKDDIIKAFGIGIIRQALRAKLLLMGVNTYSKPVKQCMLWIDKYSQHKLFNYEDLSNTFDLHIEETKLRKPLPDDILNPKEK